MPPKKKVATKSRNAVIRTEMVSVKKLRTYYKNPRIGNVDKIAKSLHLNEQYKPLVVNIGTHTGRKNEILAGNHTFKGAQKDLTWQAAGVMYEKPAWDEVLCCFVDVDEDRAKQIVIADNKTAEDGTYDMELMSELVDGIPHVDAGALGFDPEELAELRESLGDIEVPEDLGDLADAYEDEQRAEEKPKFSDVELGDEDEAEDDEPKLTVRQIEEKARQDGIDLDRVSSNIAGALQLSDDTIFDEFVESANGNEYPKLLDNMLMTLDDLPADRSKIKAWAGSATKGDEDLDRVWLYNYGVDSTSGMLDAVMKNMIVSFFTWDYYFEGWWQTPSKYVGKVLNTGVKYITTPDFSPNTDMGNIFGLWQLYRQRYLGRYFQEAGLKLLPHCAWPDGDVKFLIEETLPTLPNPIPLLLMQMQTLNPKEVAGGMDHYKKQMQIVLDELKPEGVVLYTGKPGRKVFSELRYSGELIDITHRQDILSAHQKPRKKKKTL